jgi:hypothetical protein
MFTNTRLPAGMDTIHRQEQFTDIAVDQTVNRHFPYPSLTPTMSLPSNDLITNVAPARNFSRYRYNILICAVNQFFDRISTIIVMKPNKAVLRLFRGALPELKGRRETHLPSIHSTESYQ